MHEQIFERKPSERDVLEMTDRLSVQEMLVEKMGAYEHCVRDDELRRVIRRHRLVYMRHCAALSSYLQALERQTGWSAYSREGRLCRDTFPDAVRRGRERS